MRIKIFTGFILLLLCHTTIKAQHGLNSLYSAYGIGDLEEKDYSRNFGLGSAGIGRSHTGYLNELNPASYGNLPTQNFFFEISPRVQQVTYTGNNVSQNAWDLTFKKLAVGFKATKFWGISAGITPFTTINYKLVNTHFVTGTGVPVTATTTGTGGINRPYISNAIRINKNFSVGVSTAFLFGPMNTLQAIGTDSFLTEHKRYTFKPNFTAGVQYIGKIKDSWELGLGATYRFESRLQIREKINITDKDETSLYKEQLESTYFTLPAQYGAGISLSNGTFTWVADYRRQAWNGLNKKTNSYVYRDGERYAMGVEYALKKHYLYQTFEGTVFQAGFSYNKTPLVIKDQQIKDISGTLGISFPNSTGQLRYYMGIEAGQRGTSKNGLIKENYFNVLFNFTLRDIWFFKRLAQ
ncbi:outer membrane protein transport protein [Chitinophaga nivalis]|uniref:Outer membrane protein transport protein n=1 Tax=Chitinophaga nivalis TaxID=2991709 RepID=A0ABT3IFL0_9BACT|nr:outer membrane protein transport protein [Chitinophaga nivalis]MCW3467558.1 outer membrane protein transport protein [Chitinophaga nivalis]MCW3482750.1 outer membrane protein transport protein [Chitinophaga nivalis]